TNEAGDDASGADTQCMDACEAALGVPCDEMNEAYIKASNTSENDEFGSYVSLSGDTLAVGVRFEDSASTGVGGDQSDHSASASGAVYVFKRTSGVWAQEAYLKASNTDAGDWFGHSVSLLGDTLAVGAYGEESASTGVGGDETDNSASISGAVYVVLRTYGVWAHGEESQAPII